MISRRTALALLGAAALARPASAIPMFKGEPKAFSPAWLRDEAQRLAKRPYTQMPLIPEPWRDLDYNQFRAIWFNSKKALWNGSNRPARLDLLHPGLYFPRAVEISVVEDGVAQALAFDISLFDKTDKFPDLPVDETMGFSGFRLRSELRQPSIYEEFLVFQGASYFRAIGTGQIYGLSARGLAVATGDPDGEEFPEFTHFWIEAPKPDDEVLRAHALLNSPSVTGAYSFDITPGLPTAITVTASIYPRTRIRNLGIAPLTSMFLFDETNRSRFDDFRSAVHDSEGLMVANGAGELLWRPLANPKTLQISSFIDDNPRGFGLIQRSRRFEDYADLETFYDRRPSLWIEPGEGWGAGSVTLVEIPSDKEIYDNIVAYWRPRGGLAEGEEHQFSYRMAWGEEPPRPRDSAAVLNTRIGKGYDKSVPHVYITVDFADHPSLRGDLDDVTRVIQSSSGEVSEGILQRNPGTGGLRLAFRFLPGDSEVTELRAQLVRDGISLTEVWLYRWTA